MYSQLFDFEKRQKAVFNQMDSASLLVLDNNQVHNRTADLEFNYRPNSYMVYLVGFEEPNSHLVLIKDRDGNCSTILFCQPRDPEKETWTGRIIGPENAKKLYRVDETFLYTEFAEWFAKNFEPYTKLYYTFGDDTPLDKVITAFVRSGIHSRNPVGPGISVIEKSTNLLDHLRLIKDAKEIEIMKKACDISAEGHIEAMKFMKPSVKEYELENVLNSHFRSKGAIGPAYSSICASGDNASILHYITNKDECKEGDLFLVDAACEYYYYSSDISRTFPVNGKFTDLQKKIYNIVLQAEKEAIRACTVGNTYRKVHDMTIKILVDGLISLGILKGDADMLIEEKKYMPYYMHGTGHWLGLDTHDVGGRKKLIGSDFVDFPFEPGMITTIEPGLYFSSTLEGLPVEFKGIGVRIEDDILITDDGPVILSDKVPKEIPEIEQLMAQK